MKRLIICLFILICLNNCTKIGKNMTVKGRVMNPITGEGIPDIPIELQKTSKGLPGGFKTVKTIYTNENGNFEISKGGIDTYYLLVENLGNYYRIGWSTQGEEQGILGNKIKVKKRKVMYADYYAVPYGKLQIVIKNNNCFDVNDELSIFRTHSIQDFYSGVPNPAIYTGCVNQVGNLNKAPMGWYTYSGTVTKNGITTSISDSIYLEEDETEIWNINY